MKEKRQYTLREISLHLCGTNAEGSLVISEQSVHRHLNNCGLSDYKTKSMDVIRNAIFKRLAEQSIRGVPTDEDALAVKQELENKLLMEKVRLTASQADASELAVNLKSGFLAPISALELAISKVASNAASKLEQIPIRLKRKLPNLTIRELDTISKEIVTVQNDIAEIEITEDDIKQGLEISGL